MSVRAPWICRQCLRQLRSSSARRPGPFRRFNSTSAVAASHELATISSALLTRAKSTHEEHASLSQSLSESYSAATAKRIGELTAIAQAYTAYTKSLEAARELQTLLKDPGTDAELRSLAADDLATAEAELSQASQELTATLVPKHPFAHLPCLIEIRPGAGGGEAALFAGDLLRMYTAYCSRVGLGARLLKYDSPAAASSSSSGASEAPLQEAILEVDTPGAYGLLRSEAGVHRVQRVPATESKGRTHTSTANVLVLPSIPDPHEGEDADAELNFDDPSSDYYVAPGDVKTDTMRASGAGGQHVNTTDSAVRLTHVPTGTTVTCQDERSQLKNRAKAWKVLRARLAQARREERDQERLRLRRSVSGKGDTGRSDKIRTYNWGQSRVTDHRSGVSVLQLPDVVGGGEALETLMDSVRAWFVGVEVEGLVLEEQARGKSVAK